MFAPQANRNAVRSVAAACSRLVVLLMLAAILAASGLVTQASAQNTEYTLGAGDKIKVTVFGHANMSGEFSIAGDGNVSLPFIGSVAAGGKTIRQLEAAIIDRLQPEYLKNPRVAVEVMNFRPFDIIGEVQKPGSYPYRNGMTVLNAVAMAGGFTYRAQEDQFRIRRAASGQLEKAGRNTVVRPGDVIEVLERWF